MPTATEEITELRAKLVEMQAEMARMADRLAHLANGDATPKPPAPDPIPEEVVLVISAAIAAYLGKRGHIKQIRLLGSTPWAQQGRVSIQASHHLDSATGW